MTKHPATGENAYTRVDLVMDRGEFAVRGGIIDVFPPTLPHPVRIEFFGDEIDTIREFHASDQRTYGKDISTVWATPCRELQLTDQIRQRAKSLIGSIPNAEDMLESIANAIPVEGMESLLPALVDDMEPVQGMLPKHALVMLSDPENFVAPPTIWRKPPTNSLPQAACRRIRTWRRSADHLRPGEFLRFRGNHLRTRLLQT